MKSGSIYTLGDRLIKRYGTRDPFVIADALGIHTLFCEGFGPLKGMYKVIQRNRFIFISKDLDERMQEIVCAHELAHDQLHRSFAKQNGLQEFSFYDMTTRPEYEANIVAADILVDTEDLLEYIYTYHLCTGELARAMRVDENLIALKIELLIRQGYHLRRQDYRSDFLK